MKRTRILVALLILGVLLGACSKESEIPEELPVQEEEKSPVVSGACGVSYFPIIEGKTYTYRMYDENGLFIENIVWYEDVTPESFTWKQKMESDPVIESEAAWTCNDEGMISTDYAQTTLPAFLEAMDYDVEFDVETLEFEGVTFPAADMWVVGTEWTGSWLLKSDVEVEDMGLVNAEIDVTMDNIMASLETVTVPAGTYENAMRIDSTMLIDAKLSLQGLSIPAIKAEYTMSTWYIEGIGMVKQSSEDADMLMELGSFE